MPFINSKVDGTQLHYIDYDPRTSLNPFRPNQDLANPPKQTNLALVFIHGWPMSSQMYEHLTLKLCEEYGIRCIATDRRGFGKSEWNNSKNITITYEVLAQDTVGIIEDLQIEDFIFVAASMGTGESLLSYLQMNDCMKSKCKGFIWLGTSLPYPIQTESHPEAPSKEVWDSILSGFRQDRVGFTRSAIPGVFGIPYDIGIELPASKLDMIENIVNQADALAIERCVRLLIETDLSSQLKQLNESVKLLIIHGDNDRGKYLTLKRI